MVCPFLFSDCVEAYQNHLKGETNGLFKIKPDGTDSTEVVEVYCQQEGLMGGWLLVQQRESGALSFNRAFNNNGSVVVSSGAALTSSGGGTSTGDFALGGPLDFTAGTQLFDDGVDVVELLMAAYQSAEQERTLAFPPEGLDAFVPAVARGEWRG